MKSILSFLLMLLTVTVLSAQDEPSRETQIAAVMAASEPTVIESQELPDRSYTASVTVYPCVDIDGQEMSYEHLDVTEGSTGETHTVAEQLIACGGMGAAGLSIIQWSENGAFLYYTDAREGIPDGLVTGWVRPLWRLSVADLQVEQLGQARFSFNRQKLVAWDRTQVRVLSSNDATAEEYSLSPADLNIIDVMWLPDASGILYIQADTPIAGSRSTVTHIDLETGEQTILLDTED